ncbi:glutamate--tRNA ligase [Candidatus Peregrinibacteria bacterium]|nr:glutamate--tRNA ligase [Candidatus Peregrinibacteria bacterium]
MTRTRFAPSPTGYLHVGGLRTALYNYLFAKKHNGCFLLRIEDTDQKRFIEGAREHLIEMLRWAGLEYDEGPDIGGPHKPYIQSERLKLYQQYASELLEKKAAYRCFCSAERLEDMRRNQEANKLAPMYDRHCLYLSEDEINQNLKNKIPFVVRQKIPSAETVKFKDLIRGNVSFACKSLDDQVLMKSDGFPTYHLANVVDDHLMEITHVIRGEEWLPSTPKHILLYQAFGWNLPEFAHIPLLLNKDRSKLSKRQGDVSVEEYIKKNYSKEAIINFIALLGWNPGSGEENEIFSLSELCDAFSLEKVHKAGAIFDIDKLDWFNWQWRKKKYHENLAETAKKIDGTCIISSPKKGEFQYKFKDNESEEVFYIKRTDLLNDMCGRFIHEEYKKEGGTYRKALLTIEEKVLKEPENAENHLKFFFSIKDYDVSLLANEKMKVDYAIAKKSLIGAEKYLKKISNFNSVEEIKSGLLNAVTELSLKNGQVFWPLRAALTGEEFSPGVFEAAWVLGQDECLIRIKNALSKLEKNM